MSFQRCSQRIADKDAEREDHYFRIRRLYEQARNDRKHSTTSLINHNFSHDSVLTIKDFNSKFTIPKKSAPSKHVTQPLLARKARAIKNNIARRNSTLSTSMDTTHSGKRKAPDDSDADTLGDIVVKNPWTATPAPSMRKSRISNKAPHGLKLEPRAAFLIVVLKLPSSKPPTITFPKRKAESQGDNDRDAHPSKKLRNDLHHKATHTAKTAVIQPPDHQHQPPKKRVLKMKDIATFNRDRGYKKEVK